MTGERVASDIQEPDQQNRLVLPVHFSRLQVAVVSILIPAFLCSCASILPFTYKAEVEKWERYRRSGYRLLNANDLAAADRSYAQALLQSEKFGAKSDRVFTSLNELAAVLKRENKIEQSERLLRRAISIGEQSALIDPASAEAVTVTVRQQELVEAPRSLAEIYCQQGRYNEAESFFERALAVAHSFGMSDTTRRKLMVSYAGLLAATGRKQESAKLEEQARSIGAPLLLGTAGNLSREDLVSFLRAKKGEFSTANKDDWSQYYEKARYENKHGHPEEALRLLKIAVSQCEKFGPMDLRLSKCLMQMYWSYRDLSDYSSAEDVIRRHLKIEERTRGKFTMQYCAALAKLGSLTQLRGSNIEAMDYYREDIAAMETFLPFWDPQLNDVRISLKDLCMRYGKYDEAIALCNKLIRAHGPEGQGKLALEVESMLSLGNCHAAQGHLDKAQLACVDILKLNQTRPIPRDMLKWTLGRYSELLRRTDRVEKAQQVDILLQKLKEEDRNNYRLKRL